MPAIAKANAAGIPIVIVDTGSTRGRRGRGVKTASFVGSDNYRGGQLIGEYLVKASGGTAKVAILEGIPGHETGDSRIRGFRDAIRGSPASRSSTSQTRTGNASRGSRCFRT